LEFRHDAKTSHNSRPDTRKLQTTFGLTLPPWQQGVERMLEEVLEKWGVGSCLPDNSGYQAARVR